MIEPVMWTLFKAQKDLDCPYRILINQGKKTLLDLRAKKSWPENSTGVFCVRTKPDDGPFTELEHVQVQSVKRKGVKYIVILDRPDQKQCEFLSVPKKNKDGFRELIFWHSKDPISENKSRLKLPSHSSDKHITVAVDAREKNPWKFPQYTVKEFELEAGNYALIQDNKIEALITRKTFSQMVQHLLNIDTLHQELHALKFETNPTLVIEANYADFLNPRKQKVLHPADSANIISELQPSHPTVPIIYMGTRSLAMEWAYNHFHFIASQTDVSHAEPEQTAEIPLVTAPEITTAKPQEENTGQDKKTSTLIDRLPQQFTTEMACSAYPNIPAAIIKKALGELKKKGLLSHRRGKNAFWLKITGNTTETAENKPGNAS